MIALAVKIAEFGLESRAGACVAAADRAGWSVEDLRDLGL